MKFITTNNICWGLETLPDFLTDRQFGTGSMIHEHTEIDAFFALCKRTVCESA